MVEAVVILTLPPPEFRVPVWHPEEIQAVLLSPGAPVYPASGPIFVGKNQGWN